MVGVAGKSKGCSTCRARRVRCDLARPACARCKKHGVNCGGYERYNVYIHRTAQGLVKRRRLEEVRYCGDGASPPTTTTTPVSSGAPGSLESPASFTSLETGSTKSNVTQDVLPTTHVHLLTTQSLSRSARAQWMTAWFVDHLHRSSPSENAKSVYRPSRWLRRILDLPSPGRLLEHTYLGISITSFAQANGLVDAQIEGRTCYTRSLQMLQEALDHPKQSMDDSTLAAVVMMILYELLDPSTSSAGGWLGHIDGVSQLLQHRGPHRHTAPFARSILEHIRHVTFVRSLITRTQSPLAQAAWLDVPWERAIKTAEQQILDQAFLLAGLFRTIDHIHEDFVQPQRMLQALEGCVQVSTQVSLIRATHFCRWDDMEVPTSELRKAPLSDASQDKFDRWIPHAGALGLEALSIQLASAASAGGLIELIQKRQSSLTVAETQHLDDLVTECDGFTGSRRPLACDIVCNASRILQRQRASMGMARIVFALSWAKREFAVDEHLHSQCNALLDMCGGENWTMGRLVRPRQ